jgi:hypothetical protein
MLRRLTVSIAMCLGSWWCSAEAQVPELPEGLGEPASESEPEEPALPEGLAGQAAEEPTEPELPEGLQDVAAPTVTDHPEPEGENSFLKRLPFDLSGFWEVRFGPYTQRAPGQRDFAVAESRLQLQFDKAFDTTAIRVTTDFIGDAVAYSNRINLETGQGWLDLREANVSFTPLDFVDMKIGRQILTWGTGDLLFLNDLFPKDWNSFLIGRDTEYLKAPSDALKASIFTDVINLDVVYSPAFDADRYIDGRRVNYYDPARGGTVGRDHVRAVDRPDRWFRDDEIAARLYRRAGPWELAGYVYTGFWKSPVGVDPATGRGTFPRLSAYGGSIRGPLAKGIVNAEFAYYDSRDDRSGRDPFVPNSEMRWLIGYEQEVATDFTVGVQYYVEHMLDYDNYQRTLPDGIPRRDELRHVITTRLTLLTMMQNLEWSLFVFYSPSDRDAFLRPRVHYKISDRWAAEVGANVLLGTDEHTFFGQFRDTSNVYLAVRYSF